jgi:hypothetical protein
MRIVNLCRVLVALMVVMATVPSVSALTTPDGTIDDNGGYLDDTGPVQTHRTLKFLPAVGAAAYVGVVVVSDNTIIAAIIAASGTVVGYITVSYLSPSDMAVIVNHIDSFKQHLSELISNPTSLTQTDDMWHGCSLHLDFVQFDSLSFLEVADLFNTAARLQSYDDAKRKGIPVPGNHNPNADQKYHKMPDTGNPYSSAVLFNCKADKDNGCPKQIRYYDRNGQKDMDIDFYHGVATDEITGRPVTFPHKHMWGNGKRGGHNYEGIDEIIRNWRCKNYDFKNSRFL